MRTGILSVYCYIFMAFPGGTSSKESTCQCKRIKYREIYYARNKSNKGSIPGQEDSLAKGMAIHSSILAWRIPMDRGAWQATVHRVTESDMTEVSEQEMHYVPSTVRCVHHLTLPISSTLTQWCTVQDRVSYCFTDRETAFHKSQMTCPGSHRYQSREVQI